MIELRDAIFDDFTAIASIHADNWRQNYRGIYENDFLDNLVENERLHVWQERLMSHRKDRKVTVALENGSVAGFSCLYLDENPSFGSYLDNLHVASGYQNAGIGRLLLDNCAKWIIAKGKTAKMYLWVYQANAKARKVYEHLGGVLFETVYNYTKDGSAALTCRYCWADVHVLLV